MAAPWADDETIGHGKVDVEGGTLALAIAGDQDAGAAPLILLHGWTLDHRMWQPQASGPDSLADDFCLVMPDRRGCGRSTATPDLAREADDVIAIADFLGFDRFALLGLSQGAAVALDVACRHAARLTGLIVSGAPLPRLVEREEVIELEAYREWAAAGDLATMRRDWALHPLMQAHTPAAHALLCAMLADYDGRDLLMPSELPELSRDALAQLAMPVLALTGEHDTAWRRACARSLAETAPHAVHALVPDAGHLANADNPACFNALVGAFLRSCSDPKMRPNL